MKESFELKDQLVKNSAWGMINSLINRIGGFILIVLISRMLMPEGFGRYSLAMTIALFFITFSDMGINQSLIRYVSLEIDKDEGKAISYLKYLFKIRFLLTLTVSLILLAGSHILSVYIFKDPSLFFPLIILSIYVFFISLTSFFESLFFIKKNVKYLSAKEFFSVLFRLICLLGIWFFISSSSKLNWIFISLTSFSILAFLFIFCLSKKKYISLFNSKEIPIDKKDISHFLLFINIQNISILILSNFTVLLLGIFLNSEFVGYYTSSWALVSGVISLLFSFSYVFIPILTNAKEETFKFLLKKIFRISLILALPISFGLSLLSKFFILSIYGEAYLTAAIPLSILAFVIPLLVGINLALDSFSARNKQKKFAIFMLVSAFAFIFLNYIFIKLLSTNSGKIALAGVSILNLVIWLICFLSAIYLLKKELKINLISKDLFKPLLSSLVMSAFILSSLYFVGQLTLVTGIVIILSSMIIYFSFLYMIKGITKEDLALIKQTFQRK